MCFSVVLAPQRNFSAMRLTNHPKHHPQYRWWHLNATGKATKSKEKNKGIRVVDIADSGNASPDNKDADTEPADSVHITTHGWRGKIVTRRARHRALKSAKAAIRKNGFTIVMTPSRLTGKGSYHAQIPAWNTKNLAFSEKQDVILRMNSKSWPVKLIGGVIKNPQSDKGGSFSGGWKSFVKDNSFQGYDVCAFEPVVDEENSAVFSVQTFRVEAYGS